MKIRRIRKLIQLFFINIGTSGKFTRDHVEFGMSDYLIRYVLMNCIIIMGSVILAIFTVDHFKYGRNFPALICCGQIFMAIVSFILARAKMSQAVPVTIIMVSYALLCVLLNWTGEAGGSNFLFIYMYPLLTIMLMGMRLGIILSVILGVIISLEMFIPGVVIEHQYDFDISIRMLVNYFLVFFVMVVIETTRKTKDRLIDAQNKKLQELTEVAQTANRTKSNFLASMSHEIRTPMNAITGMAELLLRSKLPDDARGYAQDIKQAGANLLSIINDILDFSKIEAGKLEIIPAKYLLASLVNDSISIIRMRLVEKPIRFYTNVDGNLPNGLFGDEARLRQIFLNLLSNAIKYTVKGHISITITQEKREGDQIWLKIVVADTGLGIKPEDQAKLFADFVQVDTKKNRGIEGTGLGLAITKRLCRAMGGDITVQSEYGKGSDFIAVIPQGVVNESPFAAVEEPDKKKVLVYEGRICYADSVGWSLENMKVPYVLVNDQAAFTEALFREEWFFVFSGYGLFDKIKPLMARPDSDFPGGKKPPLALMVEWGTETFIPGVRFVSLPVQSLSIANILNGKPDSKGYFTHDAGANAIRFTLPGVRLLVVDDISTNLKVAEGLLAPYKATVDTSLGGVDAIEMIKRKASENLGYDLVFMDHMMPEVDGIEATARIREWEKEQYEKNGYEKNGVEFPQETPKLLERPKGVPIIALTANAISGMKEMFLDKGFNDFLAKPIDVSKLDEILAKWIPKDKRVVGSREPDSGNETPPAASQAPLSIPGVDTAKGMSMTGGTEVFYHRVLDLYYKDAIDRLPLLQAVPEQDKLHAFVTNVHSLKSASASIGAAELSAEAAALEAAGKASDFAFITNKLPAFAGHLTELTKNIRAALDSAQPAPAAPQPHSRPSPLLLDLEEALKSQNAVEIDSILDELSKKPLDSKTKDILEKISNDVLMTEFDNALKNIKELLHTK